MNKISFENITKKFQGHFWEKPQLALDSVNFSIEQSEIIGFLGANGAGKTTAIKLLLGFITEDSGEVIFDGFNTNDRAGFLKELGYLPEKTYVYQYLTGKEFLDYVGSLHKISKNLLNKKIYYWAERLNLSEALNKQIKNYSKGMQQRLCFMAALLNNPKILVLDEPLSGLDPLGRREFKDIFTELNKEFGTTVFFSSHVVSDVEEICNRVLFIEKGKMLYAGSVDTLLSEQSDNNYRIKYIENNVLKTELVDASIKNEKLAQLLSSDVQVVGLEKNKVSLESIIYKVKQNNE